MPSTRPAADERPWPPRGPQKRPKGTNQPITRSAKLGEGDREGSDFDTLIGVTPPECGAADYDCNDECYGSTSGIDRPFDKGDQLFIVIDGFAGRTGNFVLGIYAQDSADCDWESSTTTSG